MAAAPDIAVLRVGVEEQPVAIVDGFHPDPDALRAVAIAARFGPARHHYPGFRADLPEGYLAAVQPALAPALRDAFGAAATELIDASFSVVATPPERLSLVQRLPHVDGVEPGRLALVHYLSPEGGDGTMFYRHRLTGFETVTPARVATYQAVLNAELMRDGEPPAAYIAGNTPSFERIAAAPARYNRAVIYRSALLHSGAIAAGATLSADPAIGRLTVTAFFAAR